MENFRGYVKKSLLISTDISILLRKSFEAPMWSITFTLEHQSIKKYSKNDKLQGNSKIESL